MDLPPVQWLAAFYGVSEACATLLLRSKSSTAIRKDAGTLRLIWIVVFIEVALAVFAAIFLPSARMPYATELYPWGVAILLSGMAMRWYSIWYLGRFFTVDVVVASDQIVIDTGPYRYIRHPSYLGALLAFFGLGLCMGNVLSLLLLLLPAGYVFFRRMDVEEAALAQGLGDAYITYMHHTKRLIPFVY